MDQPTQDCNPVTTTHLKSQHPPPPPSDIPVPDSTFGEMIPFGDWTQPMEQWAGHNFEQAMAAVQPQTMQVNQTNQVRVIFRCYYFLEICPLDGATYKVLK